MFNIYIKCCSLFENVKRCPPHQNIIDIHHAFVDKIPLLEGLQRYPNALPQRLNPDAGFGKVPRN